MSFRGKAGARGAPIEKNAEKRQSMADERDSEGSTVD